MIPQAMPHAIPQTYSSFYPHRVKWAVQTHLTDDLKLDVINKSWRLKSSVDKNGNFRNNGHCVLLLINSKIPGAQCKIQDLLNLYFVSLFPKPTLRKFVFTPGAF